MSRDDALARLKKDVRSLLISSKLGMEPQRLCQDYLHMLGHPMPLRPLGYRNVMHLVHDIPDVVSVSITPNGNICLKAVCDESTRNQAALVTKQRLSKADRNYQRRFYSPRSPPSWAYSQSPPFVAVPGKFRSPTFIPPDLRTRLCHLLSRGPVRMAELEAKYFSCFGFPLCVNAYGFYTKEDMVMAASDILTFHCEQQGPVLIMKPHLLPRPVLLPDPLPWRTPPLADARSVRVPHARVSSPVSVEGSSSEKVLDPVHQTETVVCQKSGGASVSSQTVEYQRPGGEDLLLRQNAFDNNINLTNITNGIFHTMLPQGGAGEPSVVYDVQNTNDTEAGLKDTESLNDGVQGGPNSPATHDEVEVPALTHAVPEHFIPAVPSDAVLNQRIKAPTRHRTQELVEVVVEEVLSPGHFYLRLVSGGEVQAFEDMMVGMRRCYGCLEASALYSLSEQLVRLGQVCCVSPAGWWFYRVVIQQVLSASEVEVFYLDFGIVGVVHTAKLKFLRSCFSLLPAQGVPASLAGITPSTGCWTAEASSLFRRLCSDRVLVGLPDHYAGDVLQLFLCDTTTAQDVYCHAVLMNQGHGKACSAAASAALSPRVTPVSVFLGRGMVALPEVEVKKIWTPQPWDSGEQEDEEMPFLELIE